MKGFALLISFCSSAGRAIDWRYIENNEKFTTHGGPPDATGRLASEIYPQIEGYWFELLGEVATTGVPARLENEHKTRNRWYDIYAFKISGLESKKVGVLFRDITEQIRTEEALRESEKKALALVKNLKKRMKIEIAS